MAGVPTTEDGPMAVILDDALRAKLGGLDEMVEVYEVDGRRVGYFVPIAMYRNILRVFAQDAATNVQPDAIVERLRRAEVG